MTVALGDETWALAPPGLGVCHGWRVSASAWRFRRAVLAAVLQAPWWATTFRIWVISVGSILWQKLAVTW